MRLTKACIEKLRLFVLEHRPELRGASAVHGSSDESCDEDDDDGDGDDSSDDGSSDDGSRDNGSSSEGSSDGGSSDGGSSDGGSSDGGSSDSSDGGSGDGGGDDGGGDDGGGGGDCSSDDGDDDHSSDSEQPILTYLGCAPSSRPQTEALTSPPAAGTSVVVLRSVWPDYACDECDGYGWLATVVNVVKRRGRPSVVVDFTYACDEHGNKHREVELQLHAMEAVLGWPSEMIAGAVLTMSDDDS